MQHKREKTEKVCIVPWKMSDKREPATYLWFEKQITALLFNSSTVWRWATSVERTRSSIAININKRGTNAPVIADTMMGDTKLKGNSAVCTLLLYRGGGGGESPTLTIAIHLTRKKERKSGCLMLWSVCRWTYRRATDFSSHFKFEASTNCDYIK